MSAPGLGMAQVAENGSEGSEAGSGSYGQMNNSRKPTIPAELKHPQQHREPCSANLIVIGVFRPLRLRLGPHFGTPMPNLTSVRVSRCVVPARARIQKCGTSRKRVGAIVRGLNQPPPQSHPVAESRGRAAWCKPPNTDRCGCLPPRPI